MKLNTLTEWSVRVTLWANQNFDLYIYPVISSLFAGLLFWTVFSLIPDTKRKESFRVQIDADLYQLTICIESIFSTFLRPSPFWPASYDKQLATQTLDEAELRLALHNKLFYENDLADKTLLPRFMIIGPDVLEEIQSIEKITGRLYSFNYFMTAKEIEMVKQIQSRIEAIQALAKPRKLPYGAVFQNPTCAHVTGQLLELQSCLRKLTDHVHTLRVDTLAFQETKLLREYHQGLFKTCIKSCKRLKRKYPERAHFSDSIILRCTFEHRHKKEAYTLLESYVTNTAGVFGSSEFLLALADTDETVAQILSNKLGSESLSKLRSSRESHLWNLNEFNKNNVSLMRHFSA